MCEFVWAKTNYDMNVTLIFVLEVNAKSDCSASIKISAADNYKLYINGQPSAFGPARAAAGYFRADSSCIQLQKGKNVISALVCHYGVGTYSYALQEPFFYCTLEADGKQYTASDFSVYSYDIRVRNVERYSFQRGFAEYYVQAHDTCEYLLHPGKHFTKLELKPAKKRSEIARGISEPRFDLVVSAKRIGGGFASFKESGNVFESRFIDNASDTFRCFRRDELKECTTDYVSRLDFKDSGATEEIISDGAYALCDFGRNVSGFLSLKLDVTENAEIYVIFDELLQNGSYVDFSRLDCANVIKWELCRGSYRLESVDAYEMRYLQVIVRSGSVSLSKVDMRLYENRSAYELEFSCDDPDVNTVIGAAKNTLAQNGVDLFMDCPSRERSGWINDVFFTRHSAEILTGNTDIERNTLENFALCKQLEELPVGMIPMCYPASHPNGNYIPNCAMWYAIIACEYCLKTNDLRFAELIKKQIYEIFEFFKKYENEYFLLEDLDGWIFVEWSEANSRDFVCGVNFPTNMMYMRMLDSAARLFGDDELLQKSVQMKRQIAELSYNGEFFEDNMIRGENGALLATGHISEACQYHAFYFGIANKETHSELYERLVHQFTPSRSKDLTYPSIDKANIITGLMMRESILLSNGLLNSAVSETKEIFCSMAKSTGTLWEHVGAYASCNHGCASYAAYILVRAYTGLVGFKCGRPVFDDHYLGDNCKMSLKTRIGKLNIDISNGTRSYSLK